MEKESVASDDNSAMVSMDSGGDKNNLNGQSDGSVHNKKLIFSPS